MRTVGATAGNEGEGVEGGGRLRGKLLILRLTARGLWRGRRGGSRSASSSFRRSWQKGGTPRARCAERGAGPTEHPQGAGEAQAVGVGFLLERGLVHECADGQVGQQQAIDLLDHLARVL